MPGLCRMPASRRARCTSCLSRSLAANVSDHRTRTALRRRARSRTPRASERSAPSYTPRYRAGSTSAIDSPTASMTRRRSPPAADSSVAARSGVPIRIETRAGCTVVASIGKRSSEPFARQVGVLRRHVWMRAQVIAKRQRSPPPRRADRHEVQVVRPACERRFAEPVTEVCLVWRVAVTEAFGDRDRRSRGREVMNRPGCPGPASRRAPARRCCPCARSDPPAMRPARLPGRRAFLGNAERPHHVIRHDLDRRLASVRCLEAGGCHRSGVRFSRNAAPRADTSSARPTGARRTWPAASSRSSSAAPSAPPRCVRRSLQSRQPRQSGRRRSESAATSMPSAWHQRSPPASTRAPRPGPPGKHARAADRKA